MGTYFRLWAIAFNLYASFVFALFGLVDLFLALLKSSKWWDGKGYCFWASKFSPGIKPKGSFVTMKSNISLMLVATRQVPLVVILCSLCHYLFSFFKKKKKRTICTNGVRVLGLTLKNKAQYFRNYGTINKVFSQRITVHWGTLEQYNQE